MSKILENPLKTLIFAETEYYGKNSKFLSCWNTDF